MMYSEENNCLELFLVCQMAIFYPFLLLLMELGESFIYQIFVVAAAAVSCPMELSVSTV